MPNPLSLFILGATGGTGQHVVKQALERGHHVTALVRDPAKVEINHPNLSIVKGDALNAESIIAALKENDTIISCLGIGPRGVKAFHENSTKVIIEAAKHKNVTNAVILSSFGTGQTTHLRTPMLSFIFKLMGASWILEDKGVLEKLFLESDMNVTIMQSTLLSNATARDDIKAIKAKNMGKIGFMGPTIPRTNVAGFLLNEAENQTYAGQVVCLIV